MFDVCDAVLLCRYKPKVSTWGMFPRPNNISEAYGGGRTIRPGQELESAEQKAKREVGAPAHCSAWWRCFSTLYVASMA